MSRVMYLRMPVGVTLVRTDGAGGSVVARTGEPMVTVTGTPSSCSCAPTAAARCASTSTGDADAVAAFESAPILAV